MPPPVQVDLHAPGIELFRKRASQVLFDSYAGLPMLKFPEDLRVYEHIMWSERVQIVVEVGTHGGGSALWFRDRLRALAAYGRIEHPRVVSLDRDVSEARTALERVDSGFEDEIALVEGDVSDVSVTDSVCRLVEPSASCLVVEDSAHTYETTLASLRAFSGLVQPGGFFVAEDGCVDIEELRLEPDWPRGVLFAVSDWLTSPEGLDFEQRRDLELYGISCHPGGFLQRARTPDLHGAHT